MNEHELLFSVDLRLVSKEAVYKCVYWFTSDYDVAVEMSTDDVIGLKLRKRNGECFSAEEARVLRSQLHREMIDYNLRDIIAKETANVRDLLIAKAFSHGELDEPPTGNIADVVGLENNGLLFTDDGKYS
jgi:His-Xaa-Ser system protein HxsD